MKYSYLIFLLLFSAHQTSAQTHSTTSNFGLFTNNFLLKSADTLYQLPKAFIMENSEQLCIDSVFHLKKNKDYLIDYRNGKIFILQSCLSRFSSDSMPSVLSVNYRVLPINLKNEYSLRNIEIRRDSAGDKRAIISTTQSSLFSDDFFGSGLQKSGSIVRGFSIGSNRDLTLNSGFRMQLAGRLAQDVDVTAALTDENSPIQPEGTTQTLREVDKVFVEVKHPNYTATLGDFNLQIDKSEGGEFGRINRKLQGARGIASFNQIAGSVINSSVSITGATTRGKFNTNQFHGIENMQGPYRLTGKNGETRLIIIAGSERVYLNGELMTRGETNDYIIDYSGGEVTFSSRRLITNASRITIDFEYTDQQYVRNFIGGSLQASADFFKTNFSYMQEADDPDSPIEISIDDSVRAILRHAGTDRMKASISGAVKVENGKGLYKIIDTVLSNGKNYSILIYAPSDPQANYLAQFSPVDRVPQDSVGYSRIGAGQFKFAGLGKGNYLPLQFLPMPQKHQVFDVNSEVKISNDLSFYGEYAASKFERNRFANQKHNISNGGAFILKAVYNPKNFKIGGANFGEIDLRISERYVDKRFLSLDRTNEVEFNRKWDLTETSSADEEIQELSLGYKPTNSINGLASFGSLNRFGEFRSARTQFDFDIALSNLPAVKYRIEKINASNNILRNESNWIRQLGVAEYEYSKWKSALRLETEERLAKPTGNDTLQNGSFYFIEIAPRITTPEYLKMTASAELQFRTEDSVYLGSLKTASKSMTQNYNWQLNDYQLIVSSLTLSIRNVIFSDDFKQRGNLNTNAVLVRSQTRYTPLKRAIETDVYYEFSNQRSARLERIFIRVIKGSGNYKYAGDRNHNGIADDGDFELTRFDGDYISLYLPSDQLYPIADLKSSLRLRLQPVRLISATSNWLNKVVRAISTETYFRIDEKSNESDPKQIYLLNFRKFLNERTTIAGSQLFTQDLFLFENSPDLSFRFRYSQRKGLMQFVSALERSYIKERSIRVRSQLVREIANQTDYINKQDKVMSSTHSFRNRDLNSNALISDFSYRPFSDWEVGFNFGFTEIDNLFFVKKETANINEQGIRVIKSFPGIGQLRSEIKREEVILKNVVNLIYEMTSGRSHGNNFLWQLNFDYRITANLQLSINYNGRTEAGRESIHYARMEARAFF